jgi:hypothetical protein
LVSALATVHALINEAKFSWYYRLKPEKGKEIFGDGIAFEHDHRGNGSGAYHITTQEAAQEQAHAEMALPDLGHTGGTPCDPCIAREWLQYHEFCACDTESLP